MSKGSKRVSKRRHVRSHTVRKRIYVAGEGLSEFGYTALLQSFADSNSLSVCLVKARFHKAKGGGDPLAILKRAILKAKEAERGGSGLLRRKYLFVDRDTLGINVARDQEMLALAGSEGFTLVWQAPCFEGFLLRHLEGCLELNPATCGDANSLLKGKLGSYKKGLSAHELRKCISLDDIVRAASKNPGLKDLLVEIGF